MARNTRKTSKPNGRKRKGNKKSMKKQKGGGNNVINSSERKNRGDFGDPEKLSGKKHWNGEVVDFHEILKTQIEKALHTSVEELFEVDRKTAINRARHGGTNIYLFRYHKINKDNYYYLRFLTQVDYDKLYKLFEDGIPNPYEENNRFKPDPNHEYHDPTEYDSKSNIVELLSVTHNVDVTGLIQYLFDNHQKDLFGNINIFRYYLFGASKYLSDHPTIETLIELYNKVKDTQEVKEKGILSKMLNMNGYRGNILTNLVNSDINLDKQERVVQVLQLLIGEVKKEAAADNQEVVFQFKEDKNENVCQDNTVVLQLGKFEEYAKEMKSLDYEKPDFNPKKQNYDKVVRYLEELQGITVFGAIPTPH